MCWDFVGAVEASGGPRDGLTGGPTGVGPCGDWLVDSEVDDDDKIEDAESAESLPVDTSEPSEPAVPTTLHNKNATVVTEKSCENP